MVYNLIVFMRIIRKPAWWVILIIIPYLGIIWSIWSTNLLAKSFGKGIGTTLGLIFLPFIFYPMLAFGDAKYTALETKGDSVADSLHKAIDDVEGAVDEVTEKTSTFADKTESFVSEVVDDTKDFAEKTKEHFEENFLDTNTTDKK